MKALILFLILSMLSACGMKRQNHFQHQQIADAAWLRSDSINSKLFNRQSGNRKIEFRRTQWSPPDSLGRQYINTITEITTKEESEEETVHAVSAGTTLQSATKLIEQTESILKAETGTWKDCALKIGLFALLLGIIWFLLYIYCGKYKRN